MEINIEWSLNILQKNLYHKITNFDFMVIDMAGERIDATITATPNDEMGAY